MEVIEEIISNKFFTYIILTIYIFVYKINNYSKKYFMFV